MTAWPASDQLAAQLEAALRSSGNPERAAQEKRYLKSELEFAGAGVPAMRAIARAFARTYPEIDRLAVLALVRALWSRPLHECRMAAVELLDLHLRLLEPDDITVIEQLLRDSRTWALVDDLAGNITGKLVERYRELNVTLDRWAGDGDFWLRRASMLALLLPLRRGGGDFQRFARYADAMLDEKEFFIRKAIGWVLREVSKKRPQIVYGWLASRVHRASGVTMREAVKYLPPEQVQELMAVYRSRRST